MVKYQQLDDSREPEHYFRDLSDYLTNEGSIRNIYQKQIKHSKAYLTHLKQQFQTKKTY